MNKSNNFIITLCSNVIILLIACQVDASSLTRSVLNVEDINPSPDIFEAELSADEQTVMIGGHVAHALIYKDVNNTTGAYSGTPNGIPIPQIIVNVGDEVVVKLTNNLEADCAALDCDTSIHWHGVEVDNNSDGTGVTQNHLVPGESYTYRFIAPRPGLFWFHPHMKPGPQTFAGMYGAFVVRDPNEASLQSAGIIPPESSTHTLVLSDIEFDTIDPQLPDEVGNIGYQILGIAQPWAFWEGLCAEHDDIGEQQGACRFMVEAERVLVNGQQPDYGDLNEPSDFLPIIEARSGEGIRLRLINTATYRYFRLSVLDNGSDNNLYRIGGEGGFLEKVRIEGGTQGGWNTKIDEGEILVPASGRADVVIVPTGNVGDIITITGLDADRGGPITKPSYGPAGDLVRIKITGTDPDFFNIAEGDNVLGSGGIENLKTIDAADLDPLSDPPQKPDNSGPEPGMTNPEIILEGLVTGILAINGIQGHFEDSGPDYKQVPYQGATRYARIGDVLELTVKNGTGGQDHPFHLHGFSFQPVRIIDNNTEDTLYTYDYNEFVDVIDIHGNQGVVFRVRLDDRPIITDTRQEADAPLPNQFIPSGGAAGRWVYHCHLFLHASLGMISELVVLPSPIALCTDRTEDTDAGSCTASRISIDDGSYDPNGGDITLAQNSDNPYALGDTTVTLTVTDADGLTGSCEGTVTVEDNEDPTITAPSNVTDECDTTGGSDTVALGIPAVGDNCSLDRVANDAPDFFPLGNTPVYWTVRDDSNNTKTDFHNVSVIDSTDPTLTVPADVGPIECTSADGQGINIGQATATDICDDHVNISNNAPALFQRGVTTVMWTATDHRNNSTTGTQDVTVADTTEPVISCNAVERMIPSNVVTTFTATAIDSCDADVVPEVTGFDCFTIDKKGRKIDRTDGCDLALRGPSVDIIDSGGVGDMIEWTVEAVDDSGNKETKTCSILVVRKKDL